MDPLFVRGQLTPPSSSQAPMIFDEPSIPIDGPSMDDLATILEPTDPTENKKEPTATKITSTESNPPSSPVSRKETQLSRLSSLI